jgi:hypothetical protein
VGTKPVDDFVDELPLRSKRDPDQVEVGGGHSRDRCPVGFVMTGGEQLVRVDRERDTALHRAFVGAALPHGEIVAKHDRDLRVELHLARLGQ